MHTDITKEQFQAFAQLPIDKPLQMLNLMKFKEHIPETNRTGEEQYRAYMKAAFPFFTKSNAKIAFYGKPIANLIGPNDLEWDKILIIEYAKKEDFITMITSEGYPAEMRRIALEDSRLTFCEAITL